VQLHTVHTHYCSDVNQTKYIQGCDSIHRIIPVTLFLVLLYNACFMFQHNKITNFLISVLDCFDPGTTVDDDTCMTTISKSTNSALISKQEFHTIINNFAFTNSSPSTPLSTAGISWYVHNAANIILTKIAKKNFSGTDCGEMLIFH
jgi:hypothetical protein